MRPLVLIKRMELSLLTLWQVRICSIASCLSFPSHSCFSSYRVSLFYVCVCVCVFVCRNMYSQNMWYLLLFHNNKDYTKGPHC